MLKDQVNYVISVIHLSYFHKEYFIYAISTLCEV